ncbi:MAG: cache domain-containing protein [Anaerolineales bacterium]|nr:cache domain-containing protein [Anaerolineales bacterium]
MNRSILRYLKDLYSGPFQATLVFSFTLVAAITIGIGSWVISITIENYLAEAMDDRIARDIHLAETFYQIKLKQLSGISSRLSTHPLIAENLETASQGQKEALETINIELINKGQGLTLGGSHVIAILNAEGKFIAGRQFSVTGEQTPIFSDGNWLELPIIQEALQSGLTNAATEVIPSELLAQLGLAEQAYIALIDTPRAAEQPFDPREGAAGLALVGVSPIQINGRIEGAAVVTHILNNDFTMVDQIRDAALVDSVTIFFGDLRVSTNVMTEDGQRAVGTRVSEEVANVVLHNGQEYIGTAFVVNENYITRYTPLRNHGQEIVGMLYVGARQSEFLTLVNTVALRISLVAFFTVLLTFLLATPISRMITRPLKELQQLSNTSRRVMKGDLNARVELTAGGEVGQLEESFNKMLDTLQATQEQLVQSEKLASLGQLAAGVAHELNNPLSTIYLFSDILLRVSDPDDQRRSDLETIIRETQRCKNIVGSLLDFARQHQVEAHELNLNAFIQTIINIEQKHERYRGIVIKTELASDLPLIQADPSQLQAVFTNLITNAAEAMPNGGHLTIITSPDPVGMVKITIEDSGEGVSPENLAKLFTPFFTTKPVGKGTGLGLAIVYGIIKMHRGQINIQSEVGKGTLVTIQLPIRLPNLDPLSQSFQKKMNDPGLIG